MRGQALGVLHGNLKRIGRGSIGPQRALEPPEVNCILPTMQRALVECLILGQGSETGIIPPSYALSKSY
jgi:hypothetical protein